MTDLPYMPYWVAEWSHKTAWMTLAQRGAIIALVEHYWTARTLPADDVQLARLIRATPDEWTAVKSAIQVIFQVVGEELRSTALDALLEKQAGRREQAKIASALGVAARQKKRLSMCRLDDQDKNEATGRLTKGMVDESESESESELNSHTLRAPKALGECDRFEEFWNAFPHRSGDNPKEVARLKFSRAVKAKQVPPDKIIDGAKRYADEVHRSDRDRRYIPTTARWLDEQRWGDELTDESPPPDHPRFNEFLTLWPQLKAGRDQLSRYFSEMALKRDPDQVIASARSALKANPELTPVKWACGFDRDAVSAGDALGQQITERQRKRQQEGAGASRLTSV